MNLNTIKSLFGGNADRPRLEAMSAGSAVQFHGDPDTVFVDVRGPEEIAATGTIKGAIRAPLPRFADLARPQGGGALPAASDNKRIVLVCASGMRSSAAGTQLIQMGYGCVININGGFGQWKSAGGPTER